MNKNYTKHLTVLIFSLAIIFGYGHYNCVKAAVTPEKVIITSNTHENPSALTTVTIGWSYTDTQNISGYYYTITTSSSYTITLLEPEIQLNKQATSKDLILSDGTYFFYIAAYAESNPKPVAGLTKKVGPIKVDTQAPDNVSVEGPGLTDKEVVTLTIGADELIDQVCISTGTYGNCGWQNFTSPNHTYSLQSGEQVYTLYIEVKDIAGNTAKADPLEVTYSTSEGLSMANYTSVPTLSEWGLIIFFSILLLVGVVLMRRTVPIISNNPVK